MERVWYRQDREAVLAGLRAGERPDLATTMASGPLDELAPFLAALAILGPAGHGLPRWLSYASAVLSLAFALGGAAALFWYGAFLGLLLWIVAVCVVAIAGEKLSAKAPETLTLLG